jgi:formate dehydrogenase maturation protein FdhE
MGFIAINERLKILAALSTSDAHTHIQQYLAIYERVYRAHAAFLTEHPTAVTDWLGTLSVMDLETIALDTKEPLIHFLDADSFKPTILHDIQSKMLAFAITDPTQTARYAEYRSHLQSRVDQTQLITAVLQGDYPEIRSYADQFKLESSHFLFLLSGVLQPFIEGIAQHVSTGFYEKWWQSLCPVCGRTPIVARIRKRRRYLMCAFCGAEYLSDLFLCVHCDNRDPYALHYLHLDEKPAFQIDYCTKCHKYLKVINDDKLKETIPRFLEDLLTLDLDVYAQHAGLTRDVDY